MAVAVQHLEKLLQARKLDVTVVRTTHPAPDGRVLSTGIASLDAALGGGWRQGELSELVGARSSGRTSTLMQTFAGATAAGGIVGLVDTVDRFDPGSAEAAGVDVSRVLWMRGPSCTVEMARPAVIELALRQAIRAFDLMIRAGGFAVVALDLADVPALFLRALPATTWMRLARANEGQDTVGLLLTPLPVTRSARGVTVRLDADAQWSGASAQSRRVRGLCLRATLGQTHLAAGRPPVWELDARSA